MTRRTLIASLVILFASMALLAHGAPLMGTVTAVAKDSVTIKDKEGKSVVVMLEKDTKYLKDKKSAAMADIKVGDRLVIDAHMDEKTRKYSAEEVQIGVSADVKSDGKGEKMEPAKGAKKPRL